MVFGMEPSLLVHNCQPTVDFELSRVTIKSPRAHPRLTVYRILFFVLPAGLGGIKAVSSYQGHVTVPTTFDWVYGIVVVSGMDWFGLYQEECPGKLPAWLFKTDVVESACYDSNAIRVMAGDIPYTLEVFDTAGGPEYEHLHPGPLGYPRGTDVFFICFSVGLLTSLERVKTKWFPDAPRDCPGVPCVVAATQINLRELQRETITTAQGEKLSREIKVAKYVECSAKTREGVQDMFDARWLADEARAILCSLLAATRHLSILNVLGSGPAYPPDKRCLGNGR
ncbi:Cell division control protein 42 [Mycena sanguinolenta]|uniref:Cell division control protein 42 n=1 Tax=Mycena sanguinolenta TaxID=230812 RepID=A0A8H6XTU6_9AGAR|nr:Cell division control protein 42 [Mycena sanguinolenta]